MPVPPKKLLDEDPSQLAWLENQIRELSDGGSKPSKAPAGSRPAGERDWEHLIMSVFEGQLDTPRGRFAVVAARFNGVITQKLVQGALETLAYHGIAEHDSDVVWVPGSFELPLVAQRLAVSGRYAAVICIGCVVRGDTDHYEFVAGEAARGVAEAGRISGRPVVFGILTTDTVEQSLQRAGPTRNAGSEAADTAIRMASLMAQLP